MKKIGDGPWDAPALVVAGVALLLVLIQATLAHCDGITFGIMGSVPEQTRGLVAEAAARAADPSCGGAVLQQFGVDPTGSPTHLMFRATLNSAVCPRTSILARTTTRGALVWLCMPQFNTAVVQERDVALVVLIHEILHTQGLGEAPNNPGAPTTFEISRAVASVCGIDAGRAFEGK
jgi:hypothetical protein